MGCANSSSVGSTLNDDPYCITFLGLSGVGKTSIIECLTGNYDSTDPPIHTNGIVVSDTVIKQVKYRFFDVSGFQSHSLEWQSCILQSNCVIVVVDPNGVNAGLEFTKDVLGRVSPVIIKKNIPVFVILNKCTEEVSVEPIKKSICSLFDGVKCNFRAIDKLDDDIISIFDWIETVIMHDNKEE